MEEKKEYKIKDNAPDPLLEDMFIAYYDARKNKRNTLNQLRFEMRLEHHLIELHDQIVSRTYSPKKSIAFVVFKPVTREVFAADFSDRVIHHLFYNYVNPIFDKVFIDDSYSCRKGKGTSYGIKRLEHHIRSCSRNYTRDCYVLKLDIQGFFMSINRGILYRKVEQILLRYAQRKDTAGIKWQDKLDYDLVLYLAKTIIYEDPAANYVIKGKASNWDELPFGKSLFDMPEGCGLPIGNLTSQLFSNIYLNDFDHYVKRELKVRYYGRYVDDFYLVDSDKKVLQEHRQAITAYLKEKLLLTIHPKKIYLQKYDRGVLFVGGYIKPYRTYVNRRVKRNFSAGLTVLKKDGVTARGLEMTINSYLGSMRHFRSFNIRSRIMKKNAWVFNYGYVQKCCSVFRLNQSVKPNQPIRIDG